MPQKKEEVDALIRSGKKEEIEALIRAGELVLKCDATATSTVVHEHVTKEEFEEARLERAAHKKFLHEGLPKLRAESAELAKQILEMERRKKGRE